MREGGDPPAPPGLLRPHRELTTHHAKRFVFWFFLWLSRPISIGCATQKIPNTTWSTRRSTGGSIVAVCENYRHAVEERDARTLMSLASPRYFEDGGTPLG